MEIRAKIIEETQNELFEWITRTSESLEARIGDSKSESEYCSTSANFNTNNEELGSGVDAMEDIHDFGFQQINSYVTAIYDASNVTRVARENIEKLCQLHDARILYIESVCDDINIINANMQEVKITHPDFNQRNISADEAVADFMKRIDHYNSVYEPLDLIYDKGRSFLKMHDVGDQFIVNKVFGYMCTTIVYFLMNIQVVPRTIYFSRHGESEYNIEQRIGGDSDLSPRGAAYAVRLYEYISDLQKENQGDLPIINHHDRKISMMGLKKFHSKLDDAYFPSHMKPKLQVWTSPMRRTISTVKHFKQHGVTVKKIKPLEEINAGICDGLTYEEIEERYPEDFVMRETDKYRYRYPRGESYQDVVVRLEPIIMELERAENVLVVAHQAVIRCLLAYFLNKSSEELPYIKVPLHTVLKLSPTAYGCNLEFIPLNIESVTTHRDRNMSLNSKRSDFQEQQHQHQQDTSPDLVE